MTDPEHWPDKVEEPWSPGEGTIGWTDVEHAQNPELDWALIDRTNKKAHIAVGEPLLVDLRNDRSEEPS